MPSSDAVHVNILLIEDDVDVAASVCEYLERHGHEVEVAYDGVTGLHLAIVNAYDAVVLDLSLPGIDGLTLCRRLRDTAVKATPVLMLTAHDTLDMKLKGFDSGADDYLVKPFALAELEARLRALASRASATVRPRVLAVADLHFDLDTLEVSRAGTTLVLTRIGRRLLEHLMRESHRVVPRHELERAIWGDSPPESGALRTHLHALRRAVDQPFDKPLIHTLPGLGYRITAADE